MNTVLRSASSWKNDMGKHTLEEIKKAAASGQKIKDMDVHESVIYYTAMYCYETYRKNPTEKTKKRMAEFLKPVVDFHYGRID